MRKQILKDLLKEVGQYELKGNDRQEVSGVVIDSRDVKKSYLFGALRGMSADGHSYIDKALINGASTIFCEEWPEKLRADSTYVRVSDTRKAMGIIANAYFGRPSDRLKCVGITGTNGKTSIATLLYSLFKELGFKVGLISTIEILVNEKKWDALLTTPDVISLHRLLSEMVTADCTHVFMEVSSHAVVQQRIAGIKFSGGIFTNITHDHLDYHLNFTAYIKAKQSFFSGLEKESFVLTNIDDRNGEVMIQNTRARCYRYSLRVMTDFKAKVISEDVVGMHVNINGYQFMTRLNGRFNAANLTAVFATARILEDVDEELLIKKISGLQGARGRMELVSHVPRVIVDYAHTPDALENVIKSIRNSLKTGKLITVVGCGGERDKLKRPFMGSIAFEKSDLVIFTSDNPRSEDPSEIINDMKKNLHRPLSSKLLEIVDRRSAIRTALRLADEFNTVLIAGKGHEQYQEINGEKHFFSDQQIVKEFLSENI